MSSNHEVGNKMPHHSTPYPSHSHTCPTSEANSAKCPRSPLTPIPRHSPFPSLPLPLFLSSTTTYHGASLIRPNSGSRKSPTTRREASGGASERGKNSVIYLTLFINFPFLALVTRLQRSLARWRDLP